MTNLFDLIITVQFFKMHIVTISPLISQKHGIWDPVHECQVFDLLRGKWYRYLSIQFLFHK